MTEEPIWPGVTEYLYQAASMGWLYSEGTWMEPSRFRPRCSRLDRTPIAGMLTATGSERGSRGPRASAAIDPAAPWPGCGAWTCDSAATPKAAAPPTISSTAATPASRARQLTGGRGGIEKPGPEVKTTRNPAMRRHSGSANAVPPFVFPQRPCSRSLIFQWKIGHCAPEPPTRRPILPGALLRCCSRPGPATVTLATPFLQRMPVCLKPGWGTAHHRADNPG